jgi:tetratricopeptide (TPR) repeat protein
VIVNDQRSTTLDYSSSAVRGKAHALTRLDRFDEARQVVNEALTVRPDDIELYVELGWLAERRKQYEQALDAYERALELDPVSMPAVQGKAQTLSDLGRFDDAQQVIQHALTVRPNDPSLFLELGWLAQREERHEQALGAFERALELDQVSMPAVQGKAQTLSDLGRFDDAERVVWGALARRPDDVDLYVELGWLARWNDKDKRSLEAFERALEVDPRYLPAVRGKSQALTALGRPDEARQALMQALARRPDDPELYVWLGELAEDQQRHEEALGAFDRALSRPYDRAAARGKAQALNGLGRSDDAQRVIEEVFGRRPDDPDLYIELGWLAEDQERYGQALAAFDKALELAPLARHLFWAKARVLRLLRRYARAERVLAEGLARWPTDSSLHFEQGMVAYQQFRYPDAIQAFDKALQRRAHDKTARRLRFVAFRRCLFSTAVKEYRASIDQFAHRIARSREPALAVLEHQSSWDPSTREDVRSSLLWFWWRKAHLDVTRRAAFQRGTLLNFLLVGTVLLVALAALLMPELQSAGFRLILGCYLVGVGAGISLAGIRTKTFTTSSWQKTAAVFLVPGLVWVTSELLNGGLDRADDLLLATWRSLWARAWLLVPLFLMAYALLAGLFRLAGRAIDRKNGQAVIVSAYVDLLRGLDRPEKRTDPRWKKELVGSLETIAQTLEHYLPLSIGRGDLTTRAWVRTRAAGMAAAMRDLKQWILTPREETWADLSDLLQGQLKYVGTATWDQLPWRDPGPAASRERRLRIVSFSKLAVVTALPGLTLWGYNLTPYAVEHPSPDWAVLVLGVIWPLVTILVKLDPDFYDKLSAVRGTTEGLKGARPSEPEQSEKSENR